MTSPCLKTTDFSQTSICLPYTQLATPISLQHISPISPPAFHLTIPPIPPPSHHHPITHLITHLTTQTIFVKISCGLANVFFISSSLTLSNPQPCCYIIPVSLPHPRCSHALLLSRRPLPTTLFYRLVPVTNTEMLGNYAFM